jgi:DNA primase
VARVPIADVWQILYAEDLGNADRSAPNQARVRCPFHQDRHASMDVHLEKDVYCCRSCGAAGGILKLICNELAISPDSARAWLKSHRL